MNEWLADKLFPDPLSPFAYRYFAQLRVPMRHQVEHLSFRNKHYVRMPYVERSMTSKAVLKRQRITRFSSSTTTFRQNVCRFTCQLHISCASAQTHRFFKSIQRTSSFGKNFPLCHVVPRIRTDTSTHFCSALSGKTRIQKFIRLA